jgi:hypothetical protein
MRTKVEYIFSDDNNHSLIYPEYAEEGLLSFISKDCFFVPDQKSFFIVIHECNLSETSLSDDDYGPLGWTPDDECWFDSFSAVEPDHVTSFLSWLSLQNPEGLFRSQKLYPFCLLAEKSQNIYMATNFVFRRDQAARRPILRWKSWFNNQRSVALISLYYQFVLRCLWFKAVGENAFCTVLNQKQVQIGLNENHDMIFQAPAFVFVKQRTRNSRGFCCFSYNIGCLMRFAFKIRTYARFNVYQYRGLLFFGERVKKKLTKRRLR